MSGEWVTTQQVAKLLGLSDRRIQQLLAAEKIPYSGSNPKKISLNQVKLYSEGRWPGLELKSSFQIGPPC